MISRDDFDAYDRSLRNLSEAASEFVADRIRAFASANPDATVAELREFAIEAMEGAVGYYGDAASTATADFCEQTSSVASWVTSSADDSDTIERIARYQAGKLVDGDVEGFARECAAATADKVKKQANDTALGGASGSRAEKRGVRYARVPTGPETCTFCCMLASRGFVYLSEATAGKFDHFHRNCDCRIVASDDTDLEGYDPDYYLGLWEQFRDIDEDPSLTAAERERMKRAIVGIDDESVQLGGIAGRTPGLPATEVLEGIRYDVSNPAQVEDFIETYAAVARDAAEEHSFILQRDGAVREGIGSADNVSLEGAEMDGAVVLHNHLRGVDERSFSQLDFELLCQHPEIAEMVLIHGEDSYFMRVTGKISAGVWREAIADVPVSELTGDNMQDLVLQAIAGRGLIEYGRR